MEKIPTHGGSLRVYAQRFDTGMRVIDDSVTALLEREYAVGMKTTEFYQGFESDAELLKAQLLDFLATAKDKSQHVAAYGAAAKGNTFLNYAGVKVDLIEYVADRNPAKQGKWMPGSRIPIVDEAHLQASKPDFVVILPWNLQDEVADQLAYIRQWGAKFVVVQPDFRIW